MPDQTPENNEVQKAIDAIGDTAKAAADKGTLTKARGLTGYVIPNDVGTNQVARTLSDQLNKTRSAIQGLTSEIDRATVEMTRLWNEMERNREVLEDLKRSEAMLAAAIHEGNRPAFQRG